MKSNLLFLSADAFQAYTWKGNKLEVARHFLNDADGREQFFAYLEHHLHPTYLLVDMIEEDFHMETIPHLFGPSRKALLQRKFEQYYRSTPFRQARFLRRHADGRRDDEYLLSALTNPQRITPWLDVLLARHTPIVGIYSVPIISGALLKGISDGHAMLLTWEKDAGLRQTYFNHKRLQFSRLIPANQNGTFSASVVAETPRTQQYLKSLSLPPQGEELEVFVICHANERAEFQSALSEENDLKYHFIDIETLAKKRRCNYNFQDSDSTPLLLHRLATKPPSTHYATPEHTHFKMLWSLRRILNLLSVGAIFSGLVWSSLSFIQGQDLINETDPVSSQSARITRQVQETQQSFSNTTVPAADMKSAVLLARNLTQYSPPVHDILYELSAVMDSYPRISLTQLTWQTSAADAPPSTFPAQAIDFDGELLDFGNDARQALDYLDRFQKSLTQRGYTVSIVTVPFDVSSGGSISDNIATTENKRALFKLKIIWRHAT